MERYLGLVIAAALLAGLAACSVAGKQGSHRTDDDVRHATAHRPTMVTQASKPRRLPPSPLPGTTWPSATP
jgi:uncharacterized lipoprotein